MAHADFSNQPRLGKDWLDDLPMPVQELVIADKYTVIGTIARGGMGVVYKARQENLNRIVAVKMLLGGVHASEDYKRRFLQEAKAAAQLNHPNIVSIHDWGEDSGQPYFSMDFIEGRTLAELAREQPLPARAAAEIVRTLAETMHYAHSRGVLHRDLKPSNVLVDSLGVSRITDFGLARQRDQESMLTGSGDILGTPGYLPPEQVGLSKKEVGFHSDVYGLGAILYYLLTSRPPHVANSVAETLRTVVENEPVSPKELNLSVPVDLETICLKCLRKEPQSRYSTANDLARDLNRWLHGQPIEARPIGAGERLLKWVRRHPGVTVTSALTLVVVLLGLLATTWQWQRAEARSREVRTNLYAADLFAATQAWEQGNLGTTLRLLTNHIPTSGEADLRGVEWRFLWQACRGDHTAILRGHSDSLYSVAFSPDGRHLVSAGWDEQVKIWDVATRTLVTNLFFASNAVVSVAFAPDGTKLALGITPARVRVLSWPSLQHLFTVPGGYARLAFSPDSRQLAIGIGARSQLFGEAGGSAMVWDVAEHRELYRFPGMGSRVAFSPDGRWLVFGTSTKGQFTVWDRREERLSHYLTNAGSVTHFAISPDSRFVARANNQGPIRVWDLASGQENATLVGHDLKAWGVTFTPDSRWLISADNDQALRRWKVGAWEPAGLWRGHEDSIWTVAVSPDGATLATGSKDASVRLWRAQPPEDERLLMPKASTMMLVPGTDLLAAGSDLSSAVELWTFRERRKVRQFDGERYALAVSRDGSLLATADDEERLHLWRLSDGALLQEHVRPKFFVDCFNACAFDASGTQLAVGAGFGSVQFLSTAPGVADAPPLKAHHGLITRLLYAPDGQTLFVASDDATVTIWNPQARQKLATLHGHKGGVWALSLSPDGRTLATGGADGRIKLWDWRAGQERTTVFGHAARVFDLAYAPDGLTLASASEDRTIKFWHTATGREVLKLSVNSVVQVAFSTSGDLIFSRQVNGPIRLWPASIPEVLKRRNFRMN